MGTNYYLYTNICKHCGRSDEPRHIGKSSGGWCFTLCVYPEEGINTLDDWKPLFRDYIIKDEYDEIVEAERMMSIITDRRGGRGSFPIGWFAENHATKGPYNLARHVMDGKRCIGHGEGTWDYIVGEFS